ncbi:glycosyltransferase [Actinoplanes aureus]|uniref:Glycosyltransferase n=1 Tax=Actinoplanes aureus TaxID=2792083 RepID=A0A931C2C3_9ACTN|nr:glycosyltransferase [Actinoplanes aureus]MBG0562055.1 glycosyltransferase [Actinoplanes aureus]
MSRQHTAPDAYGSDLLERQWRTLVAVAPTGPAAAALHTRSAGARTLLAYAAARRPVDDLILGAHEGRLFPDADPWAFGELARVITCQDLFPDDRADGLALFDSLLRTFGTAGTAREHQGLHAQLAFAAGDHGRAAKLLADCPDIAEPIRAALVVDLSGKEDWPSRFNGLLPAPGLTLEPDGGPPFDRIRSNHAPRFGSPYRITTIVTAYRPGIALLTAVRSLVAQSWTNHEILVVDDGSGREFDTVLRRAAALDPRVRILRMPENGGTYRARNAGLDAATGEFVTFQDSDDWSHPLRLERQAAPLLADDAVIATTSAGIRVTEDLVLTRPGFPEFRSYNLSSLMVRREVALSRLGYLDTVRKGADAEYVERARAVFGRPAVRHLGGEPLALIRLSAGSLSGADMAPGWMHPARYAYLSAFQAWHKRIAAGKADPIRPRSPRSRVFAAPRKLAAEPARSSYDVVLAGDWTARGEVAWPAGERVRALALPGRTVALLHLAELTNVAGSPANLDPVLQRMINSGEVDQVVLADEVHARLVVVHGPGVLAFAPGTAGRIQADRVVVEADPRWAAAAGPCMAEAYRLFGVAPHWAPAGPAERAELADGPLGTRPAPVDLPGTVNPARWRLHRPGPRSDRPVIGRICAGDADRERLRELLPGGGRLDVRVLDRTGDRSRPPQGWLRYRPSDVDTRTFLHQLDFYLHFPADDCPVVAVPELIVALAAGCVPVLPHRYAPLFGPAAVYCDPDDLAATVRQLHGRPGQLRAQSARGLEFVRHNHHHDRYAEAVTALLQPDGDPAEPEDMPMPG